MMKRFFPYLLLFAGIFSCSSDDKVTETIPLKVVSGLDADNELNVSATTTEAVFYVSTPETPEVKSSYHWIRGLAGEPDKANHISEIKLQMDENTDTDNSRTANIVLSAGKEKVEIRVTQGKSEAVVPPVPEEKEHTPWINPEPCEIGGETAREVALSLGVGWNLGNQMDAYSNGVSSETAWGNPKTTQALFDVLKSRGFSTVRIPVTWMGHIGNAPDYKIEEAWLSRVVEIVEMAEKAGLNAVVNMHHDGADSKYWLDIKGCAANATKQNETKKEIAAVWGQIAEAMKDKGNFLMFEAFNEIHDGGWGWGSNRSDGGKQYRCLNEWNQTFVDAVRATGGNNSTRWLSVPSYVTNIDLAVDGSLILPKDPAKRVMVSVHFYEPNDFALDAKVSDWGHTGDPSKKGSVKQDEDYMTSQFAKLTRYWVDKGTPVYIGESGPSNMATERGLAFRNYYLEYMHRAAREASLAVFYWDNGAVGKGTDKWAMFNHATGAVVNDSEEAINAMLTGGTCRDEDYDLQTVYNKAPVF